MATYTTIRMISKEEYEHYKGQKHYIEHLVKSSAQSLIEKMELSDIIDTFKVQFIDEKLCKQKIRDATHRLELDYWDDMLRRCQRDEIVIVESEFRKPIDITAVNNSDEARNAPNTEIYNFIDPCLTKK